MNEKSHSSSSNRPSVDQELEARITALVLGEASDFECEELERMMQQRPELAALKQQLENVHGLMREMGEGEPPGDDPNWRLSGDKRKAVLSVIEGKTRALTPVLKTSAHETSAFKTSAEVRRVRNSVLWVLSGVVALLVFIVLPGMVAIPLALVQTARYGGLKMESAIANIGLAYDTADAPLSDTADSLTSPPSAYYAADDIQFKSDGDTEAIVAESTVADVESNANSELFESKKNLDAAMARDDDVRDGIADRFADEGQANFELDLSLSADPSDRPRQTDDFGVDANGNESLSRSAAAVKSPPVPQEKSNRQNQQGMIPQPDETTLDDGLLSFPAVTESAGEQRVAGQSVPATSSIQVPDAGTVLLGGATRSSNGPQQYEDGADGEFIEGTEVAEDWSDPAGGEAFDFRSDDAAENGTADPRLEADSFSGTRTRSGRAFKQTLETPFDAPDEEPLDEIEGLTSSERESDFGGGGMGDVDESATFHGLGTSVGNGNALPEGGQRVRSPAALPRRPVAKEEDRIEARGVIQYDSRQIVSPPVDGKRPMSQLKAKSSKARLAELREEEEQDELKDRLAGDSSPDSSRDFLDQGGAAITGGLGEDRSGIRGRRPAQNRQQAQGQPAVGGRKESFGRHESRRFSDPQADQAVIAGETNRFVPTAGKNVGESAQKQLGRLTVSAGLDEKTAESEAFSTFSLHVSDVSFKLARAALAQGEWPDTSRIRIEEFVSAFDYGDPMPYQGEKVACRLEQSIHPFLQQRNLLRVSMRTAAAGRSSSTPLRLTLLLDNSGSMERIDRRETVRRAFAMLAQQLNPTDQVTLISFARQPRLLADQVPGDQAQQWVQIIDNMPSEGGTNIEAALQLAFEKAKEQKLSGAQNRVIMLTDGAVNLGNANPQSLSQMITTMRNAGIAFDAAGISADGLNDEVLEALTRKGDGRYYLLDSVESVDDGFTRQIAGALRPSAKNVKVQIEFNPNRVGRYKLLGFEKHRLKKEDFRNDSVDAAEMAAAEAGVAVYQFEAKPDGQGDVGSVSVRFRDLSTGQMVENCWPIPYEVDAPRPDEAAPSLRIATAAAMLAAKLRGEPLGESVDLQSLSDLIAGLPEIDRSSDRVQQLQMMIQQTRQISGQ